MTHAPHSPRLEFGGVADVAEALRRSGGRFSTPRRLVLEALFAADGPVSAEDIVRRAPPLDLSSVYRALECLEELGAVRHIHLGHGPGLYALTRGGEKEYLACERCGRLTTVESARLDPIREQIVEAFGYEARFSHFPIIGLCGRCSAGRPGGVGGKKS